MALLKNEPPRLDGMGLKEKVDRVEEYLHDLYESLSFILTHLSGVNINGANLSIPVLSQDGQTVLGGIGAVDKGVGLSSGTAALRVSGEGVEITTDGGKTWTSLEAEINALAAALDGKAGQLNPRIVFGMGSNASGNGYPHVEFRRSGSSGNYSVSLVSYDSGGTATFLELVKADGSRGWMTASELYGRFARTSHTLAADLSIQAGTYASGTVTLTKAGYYPLGVVGMDLSGTGSTWVIPMRWHITAAAVGSATVEYVARNAGTADASVTITADVLWVKTS